MIELVRGNIFEADCEALVNPVNCVGVMGAGLALEVKRRYPHMFAAYQGVCKRHGISAGRGCVLPTMQKPYPHYIINLATKNHFSDKSTLAIVSDCVRALADFCIDCPIESVAVPALGCGLGGLDWEDVRPILLKRLASVPDVHFKVYEPESKRYFLKRGL